jgi:hypothetical protein
VRELIRLIATRWNLRQRQIELRLCLSPADLVQNDPRKLQKFDKSNSNNVRIADLLTKNMNGTGAITLYLLYDIKKLPLLSMEDLDEEEMGTDTEDELNIGREDD